jgi:hypothetical protein
MTRNGQQPKRSLYDHWCPGRCVLGFNLYQAKKQPEGLQINIGPNGLKIESK